MKCRASRAGPEHEQAENGRQRRGVGAQGCPTPGGHLPLWQDTLLPESLENNSIFEHF